MTVPPLLIPGPDDPYGLVKADKLPVTYHQHYITGNLTTLVQLVDILWPHF